MSGHRCSEEEHLSVFTVSLDNEPYLYERLTQVCDVLILTAE